jgi:hypothetical protein
MGLVFHFFMKFLSLSMFLYFVFLLKLPTSEHHRHESGENKKAMNDIF